MVIAWNNIINGMSCKHAPSLGLDIHLNKILLFMLCAFANLYSIAQSIQPSDNNDADTIKRDYTIIEAEENYILFLSLTP